MEIKIKPNGERQRCYIDKFYSSKEAIYFKENSIRFRPNTILEIDEIEEEYKPLMDFFERIKESENIMNEINLLKENKLNINQIEKRLLQLNEILIHNKIYAK
jgi:hypothetical protein